MTKTGIAWKRWNQWMRAVTKKLRAERRVSAKARGVGGEADHAREAHEAEGADQGGGEGDGERGEPGEGEDGRVGDGEREGAAAGVGAAWGPAGEGGVGGEGGGDEGEEGGGHHGATSGRARRMRASSKAWKPRASRESPRHGSQKRP